MKIRNDGLSLIEVAIAMGIVGILTIISMRIMTQVSTVSKNIESTIEIDAFVGRVSTALLENDHCTKNFKNLQSVDGKVPLENIYQYIKEKSNLLIKKGSESKEISPERPFSKDYFVKDLYLERKEDTNKTSLNLIFEKDKGIGIKNLVRKINLYVNFDSNNIITGCYSDLMNLRDKVISDTCSEIKGEGSSSGSLLNENGECLQEAYDTNSDYDNDGIADIDDEDDDNDGIPDNQDPNPYKKDYLSDQNTTAQNGSDSKPQNDPNYNNVCFQQGFKVVNNIRVPNLVCPNIGNFLENSSQSENESDDEEDDKKIKIVKGFNFSDGKITASTYEDISAKSLNKNIFNHKNKADCSKNFKENGPEFSMGTDENGRALADTEVVDENGEPYPLDANGNPIIPEGEEGTEQNVEAYGSTRDGVILKAPSVNGGLSLGCR